MRGRDDETLVVGVAEPRAVRAVRSRGKTEMNGVRVVERDFSIRGRYSSVTFIREHDVRRGLRAVSQRIDARDLYGSAGAKASVLAHEDPELLFGDPEAEQSSVRLRYQLTPVRHEEHTLVALDGVIDDVCGNRRVVVH